MGIRVYRACRRFDHDRTLSSPGLLVVTVRQYNASSGYTSTLIISSRIYPGPSLRLTGMPLTRKFPCRHPGRAHAPLGHGHGHGGSAQPESEGSNMILPGRRRLPVSTRRKPGLELKLNEPAGGPASRRRLSPSPGPSMSRVYLPGPGPGPGRACHCTGGKPVGKF